MHETAYAKLNLALHVRERMADGYHRIETVFAFCEDGDRLGVAPGDGLDLELAGPFAEALAVEANNLVLGAARALRERCGVSAGAKLVLDKRLPIASGLGGGSADAAAALRLLDRWWGLGAGEPVLLDLARALGADVAACLASRPARGEGRGDSLAPLDLPGLAGTPVLLVNPGLALSTASVFRAWDGVDQGPLGDWRAGRNDLEPPAIALAPRIAEILAALGDADFARMSGSGATCFGFYPSPASRDSAAERLAEDHPDWWLMTTRLR